MRRAIIVGLGALLCAAPLVVVAQQARTSAAVYKVSRNSFGQPDLTGYWTNATITPQARAAQYGNRLVFTDQEVAQLEGGVQTNIAQGNRKTDPNAPPPVAGNDPGGYNRGWLDPGSAVMRVAGQPRTSLITTPDGQVPPRIGAAAGAGRGGAALAALAAGGRGGAGRGGGRGGAGAAAGRGGGVLLAAAGRGGQFDNPENRPLGERCIVSFGRNGGPPMFPNTFYNNNYQIAQSPDSIAIDVEMVHDVRIVHLNAAHRTDGVRPWFGDSIGHWDGDTLVVETTNIPQAQAYNGSWQNLKVTERFTRVAKDRLLYRFTVEDPTLWAQPWGGEYEFATLNGRVEEYACHEGNYAMTDVLAGARNAEKAAAQARAGGK